MDFFGGSIVLLPVMNTEILASWFKWIFVYIPTDSKSCIWRFTKMVVSV